MFGQYYQDYGWLFLMLSISNDYRVIHVIIVNCGNLTFPFYPLDVEMFIKKLVSPAGRKGQ